MPAYTRSNIRARLQRRMARGTGTTEFNTLCDDAINSGLARMIAVGHSGISRQSFVGETWGELTPIANGAFTAGSKSVAFAGTIPTLLSSGQLSPGQCRKRIRTGRTSMKPSIWADKRLLQAL